MPVSMWLPGKKGCKMKVVLAILVPKIGGVFGGKMPVSGE